MQTWFVERFAAGSSLFAPFDQDEKRTGDDTVDGSNREKHTVRRQHLSEQTKIRYALPHIQSYMIETKTCRLSRKLRDIQIVQGCHVSREPDLREPCLVQHVRY